MGEQVSVVAIHRRNLYPVISHFAISFLDNIQSLVKAAPVSSPPPPPTPPPPVYKPTQNPYEVV